MMRPPSPMCFRAAWVATKTPRKVDIDNAVKLLQRSFLEGLRNDRAGIVHEHVKATKGRDGLFNCSLHGDGIDSIGLDGERLASSSFDGFDDGRSSIRSF
jgi:hypothetical protein